MGSIARACATAQRRRNRKGVRFSQNSSHRIPPPRAEQDDKAPRGEANFTQPIPNQSICQCLRAAKHPLFDLGRRNVSRRGPRPRRSCPPKRPALRSPRPSTSAGSRSARGENLPQRGLRERVQGRLERECRPDGPLLCGDQLRRRADDGQGPAQDRRSDLPRELPGWINKAAYALSNRLRAVFNSFPLSRPGRGTRRACLRQDPHFSFDRPLVFRLI